MARPRSPGREDLPKYLQTHTVNGKVYYSYADPETGKDMGLGSDRGAAILAANRLNAQKADVILLRSAGAHIRSGGVPCIKAGMIDENGLFEAKTVVGAARSIEKICGIYFLIDAAEIVYVGQSTDVLTRIASHMRDASEKRFSSFSVLETAKDDLGRVEALYIAKFSPRYNVKRPSIVEKHLKNGGQMA